ncbi:Por secretion system C-terminal sorting domain-containing protein [Fodinibius roseus]|uniref:Por secretion system C-terminal sorting domain-containing protein n=1 Tax=Fodinibius roseus TaxID=1194090 RepID=A0A1M4TFG0_9BACT|nr:T9SS type A sorting domain-containing protein [Fodinibius roseus]SHE43115.1 Por secretion system C-terminal sorting domain-containing protein [Fodinibius roseus]
MGKTLLCFLTKNIFVWGLLLGVAGSAAAQSAGDIAFVGINSNSSEFAIVAFADLSPHTTIFFTDSKWDGSVFETGDIRWETGNTLISAGTIVTFHNTDTEEASVSIGRLSGNGLKWSPSNTTFFSYRVPDLQSVPTLLAAISNRKSSYSQINLKVGEEAIVLNSPTMRAVYQGMREGRSRGEYLQLIGDTERNWEQPADEPAEYSMDVTPFTLRKPTESTSSESSSFVIPIEGEGGWKGLSSPTKNTSFEHLLGNLRIRGIAGAGDPGGEATIFSWKEQNGGSFISPESVTDYLEPGRGYFAYLPEDDEPGAEGIQGGLPKTLTVDESLHDQIVGIRVTATDADQSGSIDGMEGFNLLGNPFDMKISVGALKEDLREVHTSINNYIYVWNPEMGGGNGGFDRLNNNDVIDPMQPFWVRYMDEGVRGMLRLDRNSLGTEDEREFHRSLPDPLGSFELRLGTDAWYDSYRIELREEGKVEEDKLDGYKLFSLKSGSINLYSPVGSGNRLAKNVLPRRLEQEIQIPLLFSAAEKRRLSFSWERPDELPREWELMLRDRKQNREINLRRSDSYDFELEQPETAIKEASIPSEQALLNTSEKATSSERFYLTIRPPDSKEETAAEEEELPKSIRLKPNYPNPFSNTTTIPYELDEPTEVTLTVWNMIGQKVAVLIDGELKSAGSHDGDPDINWNATSMPSGMYIARLEAGGEVFTRKMTLIK